MKITFLLLSILLSVTVVMGQAYSGSAEIITTYSENGKFYLKSIPYDDEFPSVRGKTYVYEKGKAAPLYVFERGFDSVDKDYNNLILSNNGEVIFYVILWGADESKEGLKSVTIYQHGQILKSFTETEIDGCDKARERCSLVYSNYDEVVDRQKSNWGTSNYRKVLKQGVDEKERFLSDFAIFSSADTVYLTDSKKQVHLFDLKEGGYLRSNSFDNIFEEIRDKGRFSKTELREIAAPTFLDFPNLKNGKGSVTSLADYLGMKAADALEPKGEQYKLYRLKIDALISQDGSLELEDIEVDDELPKERIIEFFKANKFDSSLVPKVFEKWHLSEAYFYFRKKDDQLARQEKQQEIIKQRQELEKDLTAESIDGVYIPKNLGECFVELDKLLTEIDRKEMQALPNRDKMIVYHHTLGMWMRNNWRLWGGSRLQKYFTEKRITDPEEMSSVVLYHYHDWLNGQKEPWKGWENKPAADK